MRRRIIVKNTSERKTARATRTRARGDLTREQKRIAKLGRVGMFDFQFTLISEGTGHRSGNQIVIDKQIKVDSYQDAVFYAELNTPSGHQGLIDGEPVVVK